MAIDDTRDGSGNRLLTGWKQIAFFFGKDESTAKRWAAQRGLPIHRVPGQKRASVYAYSAELQTWLTKQTNPEADTSETVALEKTPPVPTAPLPAGKGSGSFGATVLAVVLLLAVGALTTWGWREDGLLAAPHHEPTSMAESLYLDGIYHLEKRTGAGLRRAIGLFTAVVADDPDFARAYVGLADAYNLLSQYTDTSADDAYPQARAAAERAIALDPQDASAYAALAFNSFYWKRDFSGALELYEKSVKLDPRSARAHHWYALAAMHDRHFELAEREIRAAQRLSPQTPTILANKGLILFHAGKVHEALAILVPLAEAEPTLLSPHAYLATIYLSSGRYQDFVREARIAAKLTGSFSQLMIVEAAEDGFARGGKDEMLAAMLAAQRAEYAANHQPAFKLALTAAMMGDVDLALSYLEASFARHEQDLLGIRLEPALLPLHSNETYRQLVAELGFDTE